MSRPGWAGRGRAAWVAGGIALGLLIAGFIVTFDISGVESSTSLLPAGRPAPAAGSIPVALQREARPIGRGPRFAPPPPARVTGRCDRGLASRFSIHLELFAADRVVLVPAGIGVGRPWRRNEGRIAAGRCYGRFVTTDPTGVVAVRLGGRPTLGDLFAAWGRRLTATRLLSFGGRVRVYGDGRRLAVDPPRLPLWGHDEIVLEVGPYVPPHARYVFPPRAYSGRVGRPRKRPRTNAGHQAG